MNNIISCLRNKRTFLPLVVFFLFDYEVVNEQNFSCKRKETKKNLNVFDAK